MGDKILAIISFGFLDRFCGKEKNMFDGYEKFCKKANFPWQVPFSLLAAFVSYTREEKMFPAEKRENYVIIKK